MKKFVKIENLCCAHCGQKIEKQVNKIKGVKSASFSFMAEKMVVEYEDDIDFDAIFSEIVDIAKKVEPEASVSL